MILTLFFSECQIKKGDNVKNTTLQSTYNFQHFWMLNEKDGWAIGENKVFITK